MKKELKTVLVVLLLLVCITLGFQIGKLVLKKEITSLQAEFDKAFQKYSGIVSSEARSVVRSELKAFYPHVDSLATASGIKIKQIERTTFIDHKLVIDTVDVNLSPDSASNKIVNMSADFECLKTKGIIDFTKTSITPTRDDIKNMRVLLTGITVEDKLTTIYYFDRPTKKILFIKLRLGRKHFFSETYSSCKAETKTETINIIKK